MKDMLTPTGKSFNCTVSVYVWAIVHSLCVVGVDGQIVALKPNPAVSTEILTKIQHWIHQGVGWSDVVSRLRPHTVPPGYTFCTWRVGMCVSICWEYEQVN